MVRAFFLLEDHPTGTPVAPKEDLCPISAKVEAAFVLLLLSFVDSCPKNYEK
jgi:hypothetical protein